MSFEDQISARNASVYADFLLPHLSEESLVLDCGTGSGAIAVGLSRAVPKGHVIAVDLDLVAPREAIAHCTRVGVTNLTFLACDVERLPFCDDPFDVVFSHSVLEMLEEPLVALSEMSRILRPGGAAAVASVEYSGVICSGPHRDLLELFYATKERVWRLNGSALPRMGQNLRRLLHAAGFRSVRASAKYVSHGTTSDVRAFGQARAGDCLASWFSSTALSHGLLTRSQLEEMRTAWLDWSESPNAFAAFSWCRAVARKPSSAR